jgi:hypothetical protein
MVQAYNKYHHIMSRGGYELIEEKMMQEKIKQRQESAGEALPTPPSPPKRHEKWLRGRKRPSGEFTSEETRLVADNIVSKLLFCIHYFVRPISSHKLFDTIVKNKDYFT